MLSIGLTSAFEKKCYGAFLSFVTHILHLQQYVVSTLCDIGLKPKEEELTHRGYSVDDPVEVIRKKFGIEVDGPSHVIGRKPTRSTLPKGREVFHVKGIALVSVPYWEWNELGHDHNKK